MTPEAELYYTRGRLHLRRGESLLPYAPAAKEMQTALENFEKARALEPENPEIHYWMAHALRHLEQPGRALVAAQFALARAPRNEDYQRLVRMLESQEPAASSSQSPSRPAPPVRGATFSPEPARPGLTWDDVVLPAKTKRELRQMQLLLENPAQARRLGVDPPTGLLLYGPPGTGKTTIARILAAQAKCKFFATSPAEVNSMWVGEGEKAVAKLFNEARQNAPAIIFLDEVDALIPSRVGGMHMPSDKVVNQFLHEMDGLVANQGLFVVGATNRPDMLDPALVRGGRLSRQIEIPLPDAEARRAILAVCVKRAAIADDVNLDKIADEAEEFSGADLRALVNEAGMQALIRLADEGGVEMVTMADFEIALANMDKTDDD